MQFILYHLYIVCIQPSCVLICPLLASPFAWAKATSPYWTPTLTSPLLSFVAVKYIFSCLWHPQSIPHGPHVLYLGPAHLTQYSACPSPSLPACPIGVPAPMVGWQQGMVGSLLPPLWWLYFI